MRFEATIRGRRKGGGGEGRGSRQGSPMGASSAESSAEGRDVGLGEKRRQSRLGMAGWWNGASVRCSACGYRMAYRWAGVGAAVAARRQRQWPAAATAVACCVRECLCVCVEVCVVDVLPSGSVDASMAGVCGCAVVCRGKEVEVEAEEREEMERWKLDAHLSGRGQSFGPSSTTRQGRVLFVPALGPFGLSFLQALAADADVDMQMALLAPHRPQSIEALFLHPRCASVDNQHPAGQPLESSPLWTAARPRSHR